jgi:NAD(P)-dependent dehydrogenase (short-subunit alcohol dehydrogenase family)
VRGQPVSGGRPGDVMLVTGAARGLGLETAIRLAAGGFRVWAAIRDWSARADVEACARQRGVALDLVRLDVTDPSSVDDAVTRIERLSGPIYGLVNNAGISWGGYFEDVSDEEVRSVLEVNLFGVMNVTRRVLPQMRRAGRGRLVMMSSYCGRIGTIGATPYVASKFALEGWGESLSLEVRPFGIDVVMLEPGLVPTRLVAGERRVAARARDPESPYHAWFRRAEEEVDALVRRSRVSAADVAEQVHRALVIGHPRLRYVIGRRARVLVSLRQRLPDRLFERLYYGHMLRRVTGRRTSGAPNRRVFPPGTLP